MFDIKKQIHSIYTISALSSFQIAGASWVALLAARGFSMVEIGIAEGIFHLASLSFEVPSGVIADVFGRKKSMILSQCMFLISALLMAFSEGIVSVCVSLVFCAFGYNFSSGTREALAYDSLKKVGQEDGYLRYSSLEYSIYSIGNASAVLCAGLALFLGHRRAYLLDALLALICLTQCFRLEEVVLEARQFQGRIPERILRCFRETFAFLRHGGRSIALMLWNSFIGSISVLTAFFLQARLPLTDMPDFLLGPLLFGISLGGAIGARLAEKAGAWRYGRVCLLCAAGTILGLLLSLRQFPLIMALGGFLGYLFDDLLQVRTDALLNDRFPSSQRATLVSVSSLCFSLVMILMSPLMGWLLS